MPGIAAGHFSITFNLITAQLLSAQQPDPAA